MAQPLFLINFEQDNLTLIGTIYTFFLFIFLIPSWFNIRWGIRNSWLLLGLNKKSIFENIVQFWQGILFALLLITLILIPILKANYLIWLGELSPDIIFNGILLTFGVGFVEELIFRAWLTEELKLQFGTKISVFLQAIFFSIVHFRSNMSFWNMSGSLLGLFLLGILCSLIRFKDEESLWGTIGLHGGLIGIWFILNNGLIEISRGAPSWLIGHSNYDINPLGGLYGITLLTISCIFYYLIFKNQIFKSLKKQ